MIHRDDDMDEFMWQLSRYARKDGLKESNIDEYLDDRYYRQYMFEKMRNTMEYRDPPLEVISITNFLAAAPVNIRKFLKANNITLVKITKKETTFKIRDKLCTIKGYKFWDFITSLSRRGINLTCEVTVGRFKGSVLVYKNGSWKANSDRGIINTIDGLRWSDKPIQVTVKPVVFKDRCDIPINKGDIVIPQNLPPMLVVELDHIDEQLVLTDGKSNWTIELRKVTTLINFSAMDEKTIKSSILADRLAHGKKRRTYSIE